MLPENECVHCYCPPPTGPSEEVTSIDGEPQPVTKDKEEKIFYTTENDIKRIRGMKIEKEEGVNPPQESNDMIDPENPLSEMSVKQIEGLLRQASEMVQAMEAIWKGTQRDFKLKDSHMKSLYQYNETHKKEIPSGLSDEEKDQWDHFNGFDNITDDEITEIFGEDHPIIGVATSQTIDRIKTAMSDYITWMASLKEYKQINDAYMTLVEIEEEKKIKELEEIMEKTEDPEAKAEMKKSLDDYYNRKYIDFIAEPLSEKEIETLIKNFKDEKKLEYYTNRTIDKLKSLKVTTKFILEISQFEKRFLPEDYHKNSNILLLWFMQKIIFSNPAGNKDDRNIIICFIICMDRLVRKVIKDPMEEERIMSNIRKFEDQFIGRL